MKYSTLACWCFALLASHAAAALVVEPMGFDLHITLSPKATARLQATREGITVSARYYGDPAPRAEKHANRVGQIDLGGEQFRLPGRAGPVQVSGQGVKVDRLGWLRGGAKVNVNAFSSRLSHEDNILSCDFIDADVALVVKAQPIELHCTLIEEGRDTKLQPRGER
jgi:hypothetical protein